MADKKPKNDTANDKPENPNDKPKRPNTTYIRVTLNDERKVPKKEKG